jgi:putative transposase
VGGADHDPLGTHFLDAPQLELAEAACLFDLPEHRFQHLLSQSLGRFESGPRRSFFASVRQPSTGFSVCRCRVLGVSGCDIAVDTTCYERFEIGFAAVARIR